MTEDWHGGIRGGNWLHQPPARVWFPINLLLRRGRRGDCCNKGRGAGRWRFLLPRLNVLLSSFTSAGDIIDVCVVDVAHPWGVSAPKRPLLAWEAPLVLLGGSSSGHCQRSALLPIPIHRRNVTYGANTTARTHHSIAGDGGGFIVFAVPPVGTALAVLTPHTCFHSRNGADTTAIGRAIHFLATQTLCQSPSTGVTT